jgi:mRNA-degrading endonuclease toxin of MazEF toxin-antitoxin module
VRFKKTSEDRKSFRPVLIISDDARNQFDNLIVAIPTTTENLDNIEKFEVLIKESAELKLDYSCKLQFFYPRTIDKNLRLISSLGMANQEIINQSKRA